VNAPSERVRRVGAIVLAAGSSSRLGRAKQLVVHEGRTLLERTITAALGVGTDLVVVVLGARFRRFGSGCGLS
jgi:molybdenum cofactor cytidylyltransferase